MAASVKAVARPRRAISISPTASSRSLRERGCGVEPPEVAASAAAVPAVARAVPTQMAAARAAEPESGEKSGGGGVGDGKGGDA